jgi:putative ABC transport system permease protein
MPALCQDLRFGLRHLWKSPGFSGVALLTLALGVGATTALFSVVHAVLLRPLRFEAPERLVLVWEYAPDDAGVMHRWRATAGNYFDWKAQATVFEDMALFASAGLNWTGDGEPEQLLGARVTASYFRVLGVDPLLGRRFLPEENEPGRERVVILSHGLWQRRFGASNDVVGRTLELDGAPYEIVGVMPEGVYPTSPRAPGRLPFLAVYQQIWVPMALTEARRQDRGSHVFGVLGRLQDGVTMEEARAEMAAIASRLEAAYPKENEGEGAVVVPYMDEVVGSVRPALFVLFGAVGLVLLLACANIGSLLLARSAARGPEVAVRTALGAGRAALVRQFLSENLLLGVLGGTLGLAVARVGVVLLTRLSPEEVPRLSESRLSLTVLGFALALSLASALLFGLAPALSMSRDGLQERLRTRSRRFALRRVLVVTQISLAVVLVVGASLLVQTFFRLHDVDPGFSATNVLLADVNLPHSEYDDFRDISRFHRSLLERLSTQPSVRAAALTYDHPLESNWIDGFRIVGDTEREEALSAALRIVSPDYFRTFGTDVIEGRAFEELDDPEHPGVAIVDRAFVRRYFPDGVALGKRLSATTPSGYWGASLPNVFQIVGVVENVRFVGLASEPEPAFYLPAAQFPVQEMLVAVRTEGDPAPFASHLREEIWGLDPNLPVSNVTTMEGHLSEALAQPRFNATVMGLFGAAALALAALGIYGLLSSTVAQRTGEIGLRMALGARARDVVLMVVGQGARLTLIGLGIGLLAALAASRVLESLLFGVGARDPWTFYAVAAFLAAVALAASYLPARFASRIEPLTALRHD